MEHSLRVTSGFRRDENEVFTLLGCYAALTGYYRNFWTTHLPILSGQAVQEKVDCLTFEDGTDKLSRNVGN